MNTIKTILSKNVRKYRILSGMNQKELAEKSGVQTQHISNIEAGRAFVSAELMQRIAQALDVLPEQLFFSGFDSALLPGKLAQIRRDIKRGISDTQNKIAQSL
jgi:XRE family aerobic/anaerobic benzoate catabolism transcriptional regulator